MLTAANAGPGNIFFSGDGKPSDGTEYYYVGSGAVVLANQDSTTSDLELYQIGGNPFLPNISFGSGTPASGQMIYSIGYGEIRSGSETTIDGVPGYDEAARSPLQETWGNNLLVNAPETGGTVVYKYPTQSGVNGNYNVVGIQSEFLVEGGTSEDSLIADGDSGGAAFNSAGQVIGINDEVLTGDPDQPANTAENGNYYPFTPISRRISSMDPLRHHGRARTGTGSTDTRCDRRSSMGPAAGLLSVRDAPPEASDLDIARFLTRLPKCDFRLPLVFARGGCYSPTPRREGWSEWCRGDSQKSRWPSARRAPVLGRIASANDPLSLNLPATFDPTKAGLNGGGTDDILVLGRRCRHGSYLPYFTSELQAVYGDAGNGWEGGGFSDFSAGTKHLRGHRRRQSSVPVHGRYLERHLYRPHRNGWICLWLRDSYRCQ